MKKMVLDRKQKQRFINDYGAEDDFFPIEEHWYIKYVGGDDDFPFAIYISCDEAYDYLTENYVDELRCTC